MQFIGKVMRKVDGDTIRQQLDQLKAKHALSIQKHHQVENWRDQLIEGNKDTLQQFIDEHPGVDIQHLRQLIRMAQKEKSQDKAPAHARKLFRYLRDTVLAHQ